MHTYASYYSTHSIPSQYIYYLVELPLSYYYSWCTTLIPYYYTTPP